MKTRAVLAIEPIAALGHSTELAALLVGMVIEELMDPDRDMLDAGLEELNRAPGPPHDREHGTRYRRDRVHVIWRAMLDRGEVR